MLCSQGVEQPVDVYFLWLNSLKNREAGGLKDIKNPSFNWLSGPVTYPLCSNGPLLQLIGGKSTFPLLTTLLSF